MRILFAAWFTLAVFSGLALADDFSGKLLDSGCYDRSHSIKGCDAGDRTTTFVLDSNGKVYHFDSPGNNKVLQAMKQRADRSADPKATPQGSVRARITGKKGPDGDLIVEVVEIQ